MEIRGGRVNEVLDAGFARDLKLAIIHVDGYCNGSAYLAARPSNELALK